MMILDVRLVVSRNGEVWVLLPEQKPILTPELDTVKALISKSIDDNIKPEMERVAKLPRE